MPTPDPALIDSMCMRFDHSFWIDSDPMDIIPIGYTEAERDSLRRTMRQLWEEVVGLGFYKYPEGKAPSFPG